MDMNVQHLSDCALHNEPAYPAGPCNCAAGRDVLVQRLAALAAEEPEFDGSPWELDGYHAEDAKRHGARDVEIHLAREVLPHLHAMAAAHRRYSPTGRPDTVWPSSPYPCGRCGADNGTAALVECHGFVWGGCARQADDLAMIEGAGVTQEEGEATEPLGVIEEAVRLLERRGVDASPDGPNELGAIRHAVKLLRSRGAVPTPQPSAEVDVEALVRDAGQAAVSAWRNNASGLGIRAAVGRAIRSRFAALRTKGGTQLTTPATPVNLPSNDTEET